MSMLKQSAGLLGLSALAGLAAVAQAGGPFPGPQVIGPDITICQLYGLQQFGRTGSYPSGTVGLAMATTSWNIGTVNHRWEQSTDPDHPFISLNLFRKKTFQMNGVPVTRFEQIGQNWVKHGFFALSNLQCGTHPFAGQVNAQWPGGTPSNCQSTNGTALGVGCTDTYSSSLNATQSGNGPRYEINPWTSGWSYAGSVFQVGGGPTGGNVRRLQVREADLIPPVGQTYNLYGEGYYNSVDDVEIMDSAGWKPVSSFAATGTSNPSSTTWSFTMSGSAVDENMGFAIDAWTPAGAQVVDSGQSVFAQGFPIVEAWTANADGPGGAQVSPDGRGIVSWQVTDIGGGQYQYEYLILNIDMDRQIGSLIVPVPSGVNVTNMGWSGVFSHNEPRNGQPIGGAGVKNIDNDGWASARNSNDVTWSTDAFGSVSTSNPLRWGTSYNFWFTADAAPDRATGVVSLFKPGSPTELSFTFAAPAAPPPPVLPGAFGLSTPADGSVVAGTSPTLTWGSSSDATGYDVTVDDTSDFSSPVHTITVAGTSTNVPSSALNYKIGYFWRVAATNIAGSTASTPASFAFRTPPCLGDADYDKDVDFGDITIELSVFGASYSPGQSGVGDSDANDTVNFADLTKSLEQFGNTCP